MDAENNAEVLAKLQRHRGYQGWRIRPYPFNPDLWLVETYTWIGRGNRKGWRSLWDEKRNTYQTFHSLEQAYRVMLATQEKWSSGLRQDENL